MSQGDPLRASPFFILQVGLGGTSESGRPAAHATGLGDGAPPLPFPLACVVGRLSFVKKNWDYRRLEIAPRRLRGAATVDWPRARCSFPASRLSLPPLGASELFSFDYRTPEGAPWVVRGTAAVSWLRAKSSSPASKTAAVPLTAHGAPSG